MNNISAENSKNPELHNQLKLSEALKSFEGTPIASLIVSSLEAAGYDPSTYNPENELHEEYRGFPATSSVEKTGTPNLSPIIVEVNRAIDEGEITVESPAYDYDAMHLKPDTDPYGRLTALMGINILVLKDAETDEKLAYAVDLSSDGGRDGVALISTNDVIDNC